MTVSIKRCWRAMTTTPNLASVSRSSRPAKRLHGLTADRTEFLGRKGNLQRPAALDRIGLASVVEPGLDPCAACNFTSICDRAKRKKSFS